MFFEEPPHGAHPLDRRLKPVGTTLIPAVKRTQLDSRRMLVIHRSVLSSVLAMIESAPVIIVGQVAHVESLTLRPVESSQRPIPAACALVGSACYVDVAARVLAVVGDAGDKLA